MYLQGQDITVDRGGSTVSRTHGRTDARTSKQVLCHTQSTLTYQSTFLVNKYHQSEVLTFVNMFSFDSYPL